MLVQKAPRCHPALQFQRFNMSDSQTQRADQFSCTDGVRDKAAGEVPIRGPALTHC